MNKYFVTFLATLIAMPLLAQAPATKPQEKGAAPATGGPPRMPPAAVGVMKAINVNERAARQYPGIIEAIDMVEIPVRVNAFIKAEHFKEGYSIKKGDLMYELEDVSYRAQEQAAEARRDQVIPELKYALQNYNRQKGLQEKDVTSDASVEEAERQLMLAKASLAAADAALLDAKNTVSYTKIYAPLTGRIGRAVYSVGQYVTPTSKSLVTIVQTDPIYIKFSISEREYLNLFGSLNANKGKADVKIKLSNGVYLNATGKLALVDNKVQTSTGTITMWFEYPNTDQTLIPGGYVSVSLAEKSKAPLVGIKNTAIMTDKNGSYVYVVSDQNIVERRNVILADVIDGVQTVYSGLNVGELVIVDGGHKAKVGVPVNPVEQ